MPSLYSGKYEFQSVVPVCSFERGAELLLLHESWEIGRCKLLSDFLECLVVFLELLQSLDELQNLEPLVILVKDLLSMAATSPCADLRALVLRVGI